MYPAEKLNTLGLRKELVRVRIAARRAQCVAAATQMGPTLALADQGVMLWRSIRGPAKWIGLPAAWFLFRRYGRRFGGAKGLLSYAPVALQMIRMFGSKRRQKNETKPETASTQ